MIWTVERSLDEDEVNVRMIVRHVDSECKSGLRRRNFEWTLVDSVKRMYPWSRRTDFKFHIYIYIYIYVHIIHVTISG